MTERDRRALRSIAAQFWMNGVVFASFIPRLPEIRRDLDVDLDGLGLLLTVGMVGGLAASAVCGSLIGRHGTRRVLIWAAVGLIVVLPSIGIAGSPLAFLAALAAVQFFDVLVDVAMNMQGSWLSSRRAVPVMNRLHGLWSVGTVVGGVVAAAAASRVSLRAHLVLVAAVLAVTLAYVAPGLLERDEVAVARSAARRVRWRQVAIFGLLGTLAIFVEMTPSDWATLRLVEDIDIEEGVAGIGYVATTAGMVTGRFGGDFATARIGRRALTIGAVLLSVTGLAIGSLAPTLGVALVGFFLAGLGAAVVFPGLYELAARSSSPGALLGAMTAGIRVGAIAMPVTIGALAAGRLDVGQAMLLVAGPAAVALVVIAWSTRADPA